MENLAKRIAQTKQLQAAARSATAAPGAKDAATAACGLDADLKADFDSLLEVIGRHNQYDPADFAMMQSLLDDTSPKGIAEMQRTVQGWRLDVIALGLTGQVDEAAAQRCWQAFGGTPAATGLVVARTDQPATSATPTL